MAAPLVIRLPHRLGKQEALRRLQPGLSSLAANLPILTVEKETWTGDRMDFSVKALGQTATGLMDVAEDHIRVEVVLPWMLQALATSLRTTIETRGRVLLEKK